MRQAEIREIKNEVQVRRIAFLFTGSRAREIAAEVGAILGDGPRFRREGCRWFAIAGRPYDRERDT